MRNGGIAHKKGRSGPHDPAFFTRKRKKPMAINMSEWWRPFGTAFDSYRSGEVCHIAGDDGSRAGAVLPKGSISEGDNA
jgi:hypothetical protein